MRTVRQWVDWAANRFDKAGLHFGHGTDNSGDEAAWLALHALGRPADRGIEDWEEAVSEDATRAFVDLVESRVRLRCPAAYLTGTAWFAGLEFEVSDAVLVPRSPIAELIQEGFEPWISASGLRAILDIGTGSGCIAIACAQRFPNASVVACDISETALEVARRNLARHSFQDRVRLVRSDLFDSLGPGNYDLIVSNPPYVPESSKPALPDEFLAEPAVGLYSGFQGLETTLRILAQASEYLSRDGILICEVGESQERLSSALPRVPFLWLEFSSGGSGIFLLEREPLAGAGADARALLSELRA